ncbi:MAG: AAA family ATPase [Alphaproteobacteria bacterium]
MITIDWQNPSQHISQLTEKLFSLRQALQQIVLGQERVIDQSLTALLAGGHSLLTGLPGLAKTRLVHAIGQALALDVKRIQCTPDLMPADILGVEVLDESREHGRSFRFIEGPVFCQLLMADEINRASPRTQSALLQAMQEHSITVNGVLRSLPTPFHVMATQNPIEQEGTYPLPEAQLDRFLMGITISYPDAVAEKNMVLLTTGSKEADIVPLLTAEDLLELQSLVRIMPLGEMLLDKIIAVTRAARPENSDLHEVKKYVNWGPGPRAGQALALCCRALCLLEGRLAPSLDDVERLLEPVLAHRMQLNYQAHAEGISKQAIIKKLAGLL